MADANSALSSNLQQPLDTTTPPPRIDPNIPACDGCRHPLAGTLACSRCHSAWYCSKDCQVKAWKCGHKNECATFKEDCITEGQQVVEILSDTTQSPAARLISADLGNSLMATGAYRAAVAAGLYAVVGALLEDDLQHVLERFREGQPVLYTRILVKALFGGVIVEGLPAVDLHRVKDLLTTDSGYTMLMDVTFLATTMVFDSQIRRQPAMHRGVLDAAIDLWVVWSYILPNKALSDLIFLKNGSVDDESITMAKKLQRQFKLVMSELARFTDAEDHALDTPVTQVLAMLDYRFQEYRLGVDLLGTVGLKGKTKRTLNESASIIASATMIKGAPLSEEEASAAMVAAYRQR